VEAELITSNREEVGQLHKLIAQKDDDLQRTVQKYEQVLQVLHLFIYMYINMYNYVEVGNFTLHLKAITTTITKCGLFGPGKII
jgi:hypothetical protein